MSKRIFTKEKIKLLKRNSSVKNCSERSILYSNDFKVKAVKQYESGLTSREIFGLAGFDLKIIGRNTPKECLKSWNKKYKRKGISWLKVDNRKGNSGRPKKIVTAEKDKIKRLEAQVAYLKAENDFLVKLRAKQAE